MAVEHAMFTFDDLKVTSRDDRMTDRQNTGRLLYSHYSPAAARVVTTKVLSSRPRIKCGETNYY